MHPHPDLPRLLDIVADLLAEAKRQGASAAEAGLSVDKGLTSSVRLGAIETLELHQDQGLGVTVYFWQRKGSASTTDLSPASIKETVQAACSFARYGGEDDCAGLPDITELASDIPDLDLYHPWAVDADAAAQLAIACEDAARAYHPEISNSEGASVSSHQGIRILGNSLGFLHGYPSTRHSLSCSVIGQRGDSMQRDYWYSVARDATQLESAQHVGEKAAQRTVQRLAARPLATRRCPVLFNPEMAASLLGAFVGAISGGSLYRKASFLLDSLGTSVFPEFVRIHEQPHLRGALASAAYDSDGVATTAHDLVHGGIVQSYVLGTYSARKLGLRSTGNGGGVHNLGIEPGERDLEGLLRLMDTGLLVTELLGQGVNRVTGDYSRGAAGFWVERGEIQYPVEEITIAGNLKDMFRQFVAVGNDVDLRGAIRTGSILVEAMSVAGE